ncbi:MAG: GTPase Era [Armatimonadota bacterium]|nr:GTPase Era [Armatimonadota bacterium]MDR7403982.1 GTPase Era [Armatimonadota bacterium]
MPAPGSSPPPDHRSGFVAVVGRPNVGKSTLVNRLVGHKVAITAPVPQTTRSRLAAILTLPHAQLVFVDTPGLHQPRHRLGQWMVETAVRAVADADAVAWVVDASEGVTAEDVEVAARLRAQAAPVVAVLNKVDRTDPAGLAAVQDRVAGLGTWTAVLPVSALTGAGLDRLVETLVGLLPVGPPYYPPDMVTDQPEQFLARELIREAAIHLTREEVPHSIAVEIEEFAPREGTDVVYIRATLHVERESHKKILIGRDGRMLREVGRRARQEIEALLGRRVYLDLWVKTTPRWRDQDAVVRRLYPQ